MGRPLDGLKLAGVFALSVVTLGPVTTVPGAALGLLLGPFLFSGDWAAEAWFAVGCALVSHALVLLAAARWASALPMVIALVVIATMVAGCVYGG